MTGRLLRHMLTIQVNNADYRNAPSTSVALMGYIIATSRLVPELVLSSDMLNTHAGAADRKLPRACQKKKVSTGRNVHGGQQQQQQEEEDEDEKGFGDDEKMT
ncbi:hypothetical protein MY8738_005476 [Beauveria namnaoensis]